MGLGQWALKLSVGVAGLAVAAKILLVGTGAGWTVDDIPDGVGKTAIVTGANAGLGFSAAKFLSQKGYHVIMGCRSKDRGAAALKAIQDLGPKGVVELELLDLAEPASVKDFASRVSSKHAGVDLLVNNAGVMMLPDTKRNSEGWEMQMSINHLGHFLLTGLLLPQLKHAKGRIVIHASSMALPPFGLDTSDLNWTRREYSPIMAYVATKRANVLFTHSLNERLKGTGVTATCAHPGATGTELQGKATGLSASNRDLLVTLAKSVMMLPDQGVLSLLRAAVEAPPDKAVGPLFVAFGAPIILGNSLQVIRPFGASQKDAESLWEQSEKLTGINY